MINIFVNTFKPIKVFYHKTVNSIKVFLDKLFKYVSNFLKTKPLLNKITLNFVKYLVHIISLFEKYTYILFFMIFIEICFKIKTVINSNDRTLFLVYCLF